MLAYKRYMSCGVLAVSGTRRELGTLDSNKNFELPTKLFGACPNNQTNNHQVVILFWLSVHFCLETCGPRLPCGVAVGQYMTALVRQVPRRPSRGMYSSSPTTWWECHLHTNNRLQLLSWIVSTWMWIEHANATRRIPCNDGCGK